MTLTQIILFLPITENAECALKPYGFKMEEIEGFRYRCRVGRQHLWSYLWLSTLFIVSCIVSLK